MSNKLTHVKGHKRSTPDDSVKNNPSNPSKGSKKPKTVPVRPYDRKSS